MNYGHVNLPDEEYYALHAVSNSKLGDLAVCPRQYWSGWRLQFKETEAMRFGKLFHCFLLEPTEFDKRYFLFDEEDRPDKTKTMAANENKDWKRMIMQMNEAAGLKPYTREEYAKLEAMKHSVWDEVSAWALVDTDGSFEHSYVWQQEVEYFSGREKANRIQMVDMKLKADKWIADSGIILDLKTTNDASPTWWDRHAWEYGYHRQAAIYSDALGAMEYYLLVVETTAPFNVALYRADGSVLEKGRHHQLATAGPGWGYKPLLERLCKLRDTYGIEFPHHDPESPSRPWPMYSYWAKPRANGILEWRPPLWS